MNEETLIGEISDKLKAKLGKLIQGKLSEAEFSEIVRTAVWRELDSLREKVNQNSMGKENKNVRTI